MDGLNLEVARGGAARESEEIVEIDMWPWLTIPLENGVFRAHIPAAVALAWLSPEERGIIRARANPESGTKDEDVKALVREFNVWGHAITHLARTTEEDLVVLDPVPLKTFGGEKHRLENAEASDYNTYLYEYSRPPSKGGNTGALHAHVFHIDGERYSFFGRGSRKFIQARDRATFDYVVTPEGWRNVIMRSIVCRDSKGKIVRRGNRSRKPNLRTSPTRVPASRREARD